MNEISSRQAVPSANKPAASIPSPCIGICESNDQGICIGCARTDAEVAAWRDETNAWRDSVWRSLPGRLDALGVTVRRLGISSQEILDFIEDTIRGAKGNWILGVHGGVGEFNRDEDEPVEITRGEDEIVATTERAALRLSAPRTARLLTIGAGETKTPRAYALATHVSRVALPIAAGLTELGPDQHALRPSARDAVLFDVGLERDKSRFCIRSSDAEVLDVLRNAAGSTLAELFQRAGPTLLNASPTRVIETGLGRVEIDTPIPPPGGVSPPGPHTHLLPDHLALGLDCPPGLAIPDAYAIGALFYPAQLVPAP